MKQSSVLQLYRGPRSSIDGMELQDGSLYFTTDTKQILLDCSFTDSEGTNLNWHLEVLVVFFMEIKIFLMVPQNFILDQKILCQIQRKNYPVLMI